MSPHFPSSHSVSEGIVKPSPLHKRVKKLNRRNLSSHLRRFDSSMDSDSMMLPDPEELELSNLIVNTDGSISPIDDRTIRIGTDRTGKLILVKQTDSRQCFLSSQARRMCVSKRVKEEMKTSLGNHASRFAKLLRKKSEEIASSKQNRENIKEYNARVLERAWELRTGDYINIKAEIVQEFGSDVFEKHKKPIKGLLEFLSLCETCGAELVQTSSDSRSKRHESIPWFMEDDKMMTRTRSDSEKDRFLKAESRMPSVLRKRKSIRRSIWLQQGQVTTRSNSGSGLRKLMSDVSWNELVAVKGGDKIVNRPTRTRTPFDDDDDDKISTNIPLISVSDDQVENNEIITLGSGFNGSTFLYRSRDNHRLFAVKTIDMIGTDNRNQVTRELATLVQRRGSITISQKKELSDMRCIVHLFGYHVDEAKISLILEYMNMGGLDRITSGRHKLPERVVAAMTWQIATGLHYLHETKRSIHRDIKPANILWASNGHVKISDFGLATRENERTKNTLLGTRMYISPERYEGTCTFASDIYALGLVLVELLTGHHALVPDHENMTPAKTEVMLRKALKSPSGPTVEDAKLSKEFTNLLQELLVRDHTKRLNAADLLQKKWFAMYDVKSLHDAVRIVRDYALSGDTMKNSSRCNSFSKDASCPVHPMYVLAVPETPRSMISPFLDPEL